MNPETLIRPNILKLQPYHSARQDYSSGVLLDANENSFGSVIQQGDIPLHRYPDPFQRELRSRLALLHHVKQENIFVGVGSDEAIDLLIRIFCEPGTDSIMTLDPTYGMYRVAAAVNNVRVESVLLDDSFQIDLSAVQRALSPITKIIFCCSPNNPTANLLRQEDIIALCTLTSTIVVVDEAYIDFSDGDSMICHLDQLPNLIVLRTLSKAWGLAALRLGYAIAHPLIVSYLLKVKSPYNINTLTSKEALRALDQEYVKEERVKEIRKERSWLIQQLQPLPCIRSIFPSDANFLLVRCSDARSLHRQLAEQGIIVRDRSSEPTLEQCLRITVGTRKENELLIEALKGCRV